MSETIPERISIPGTYEIFRQRRGLGPEHLVTLDSFHNTRNVLSMFADMERSWGQRVKLTDGGFSAYLGKRKVCMPFVVYWYEEIIPDDGVKIDRWLDDALFVARVTAAAEVRRAETDAQADYRRSEQ